MYIILIMKRSDIQNIRILAIVPAYNEVESIEATMDDLITDAPFVDVVIVDDGSTDDTAKVCIEHGWNLISLPINLGLSDAFQAGMKYADAHDYDYVVQFDADGQHIASFIEDLLTVAIDTDSDIVIGSRFLTSKKKKASARMIGSAVLSRLLKLTAGQWIHDPTSGMRLYGKRPIKLFATKYDYGPEPDTVALFIRKGFNVTECQVDMRERVAGKSYLSLHRSMAYMIRMAISLLLVQWVRN